MRCPKCAADVDPLRDFCPKCGTSTEAAFRERERRLERGRAPEELKSNRKTVLAIGGAVLLLAVVGRVGFINVPHAIHVNPPFSPVRVENEAVTIGAPQLFEAYHTDSDAANRRFGGRQMVVTGEFVRTVPDGYGSIDMRLKTNHPDMPLGIDLDNHSLDAATKLQPGETVTVSCQKVAGSGDNPWLADCIIQAPNPGIPAPPAPPTVVPPPPPKPPTG